MKLSEIDALLKASLPPNRYEHSVRVMHNATVLAEHYGLDEKKAQLAGLIHDCGREISTADAPGRARAMGLTISLLEQTQPVLLHARLGPIIAREKYKITDQEILRAIALHTTGGDNMTELDKVIFLTDYTEPERKQKGVEKVRELLRKNLNQAMLEALRQNIEYLLERGRGIHPDCIDGWNYFLLKADEGNYL